MDLTFFSTKRFIILIAAIMSLSALGIDAVLPAFPYITQDFSLSLGEENRIQLLVFTFMLGFALFQLPAGILSDVFGRKPVLCVSLGLYICASMWAAYANTFESLLWARFFQGLGLSAPRVVSLTIVRDVRSGRAMSQMMSFVMMVFIIVPIIAPALGQTVMKLGSWHSIFWLFVGTGILVLLWALFDLPETLSLRHRQSLQLKQVGNNIWQCLSHRQTLIYLLMLIFTFAMLMVYVSQAEQIFGRDVYGLGDKFPLIFALTGGGMVIASFTNSRVVMRVGMHKIVRYGLFAMLCDDILMVFMVVIYNGLMPLGLFVPLLMVHMFCYSLLMPNLNSLILEPHATIAGTASALIGALTTIGGVLTAQAISSSFNGTLYPIVFGFITLTILLSLLNFRANHVPKTTD